MKKLSFEKGLFYILLVVFILSLIPIFWLGTYSFPYYDDFNYGFSTYAALQNGASFIEVLKTAWDYLVYTFFNWQGTYTTIFLFCLHPGIFGESWYFLTPIIIISLFCLGNLYLTKVIFKDYLQLNIYKVGIIFLAICLFQIQNLPSAFQAFYWWNSAIMHTFSYILIMFLAGLLLSIIKKPTIFKMLILMILGFLVGGSAYETALFACCLYVFVLIGYLVYIKLNKLKYNKLTIISMIVSFIIALGGFAINIGAPGNAVRIEQTGIHVPALLAIAESFVYSIVHTFEYISLKTILVSILVAIFSYKSLEKYQIKFVRPILFILASWCMYSVIFTPAIYGEHYVAAPRYLNVLYFSFYWVMIFNLIYCLYYYKDKVNHLLTTLTKVINKKSLIAISVVLFFGVSGIFQYSYLDATSSCALVDIFMGNASSFKMASEERLEILTDDNIKDAKVHRINNKVRLFEIDNLTKDADNTTNKMYAKYYMKDSVVIED